jgi:hypothetical protein
MAAHQKLDRRRDDPCVGGLRKRAYGIVNGIGMDRLSPGGQKRF